MLILIRCPPGRGLAGADAIRMRMWSKGLVFAVCSPGCQRGRELPLGSPPEATGPKRGEKGQAAGSDGNRCHGCIRTPLCGERLLRRVFCGAKVASDAAMMPPGMAATCC